VKPHASPLADIAIDASVTSVAAKAALNRMSKKRNGGPFMPLNCGTMVD